VFTARYGLTLYGRQCNLTYKEAVPRLRRLVADLWQRRTGRYVF